MPPDWIGDAAGAEAWAYFVVMRENVDPPHVFTDCKGVLDSLTAGVAAATSHEKRLARVWNMTARQLDEDFSVAASRTVWMPAHGAAHTVGVAKDSRGEPITALMWRANRLADLLAKQAAAQEKVPAAVIRGLDAYAQHVRYSLAKVGVVTLASNRCTTIVLAEDGTATTVLARDSDVVRPPRSKGKCCEVPSGPPIALALPPQQRQPPPFVAVIAPAAQTAISKHGCARRPPAEVQAAKRRRDQSTLKRHHEAVDDEVRTAKWLRTRQLPGSQSDAPERLEGLRMRVQRRAAARSLDQGQPPKRAKFSA